jgi:hypothetical protein
MGYAMKRTRYLHDNFKENKDGILAILDLLEKDKQQVMIYTGFCFAIPSITLAIQGDLTKLQLWIKIVLIFSFLFFLIAGTLFAIYAWRIHMGIFETLNHLLKTEPSEFVLDELVLNIFGRKDGFIPKGFKILYLAWGLLSLALIGYMFFLLDYVDVF